MFKVSKNTSTTCHMYSKLTIKISEQHLMLLLLTLNIHKWKLPTTIFVITLMLYMYIYIIYIYIYIYIWNLPISDVNYVNKEYLYIQTNLCKKFLKKLKDLHKKTSHNIHAVSIT